MFICKQSFLVSNFLFFTSFCAFAQGQADSRTLNTSVANDTSSAIAFNVGLVSDYRFRGIAQTSFDPALQVGLDYSNQNGMYFGAFASNVSWVKDFVKASDGATEIDAYFGYKSQLSKQSVLDAGFVSYNFPGNTASRVSGAVDVDTVEGYVGLTSGAALVKYSVSFGNFFGTANSKGSEYLEIAYNFDIGNGYTVTPHVGRQLVAGVANGLGNYTDYSVGVAKDFGAGVVATLSLVGSNAADGFYKVSPRENLGKNGVVVGLKYSF